MKKNTRETETEANKQAKSPEVIERHKAQQAAWWKAHPGKVAEYAQAHRATKKDRAKSPQSKARAAAWRKANQAQLKASRAAWYQANKERVAATQKAYREANAERIRARVAARMSERRPVRVDFVPNPLITAKHQAQRERDKASHAAKYAANKEKMKAANAAYRAALKRSALNSPSEANPRAGPPESRGGDISTDSIQNHTRGLRPRWQRKTPRAGTLRVALRVGLNPKERSARL